MIARVVAAARTSNVIKVKASQHPDDADVIGFEHEAGLMVFVPQPTKIQVYAAPRKEGPYFPVVGGYIDAERPGAYPITAAFPATFLKLVGDNLELDVSIKA